MTDKTGLFRGALGANGGAVAAVGGVAVAAAAGMVAWQVWREPAPIAPVPQPVAAVPVTPSAPAPAPVAPPVGLPAPQPPRELSPAEAAAPRIDTFRLGTDGTAVLAGVAPEASAVLVLIDGAEVARTDTDGGGRFAALFDLAPAPVVRALTLRSLGTPQGEIDSRASLMIAAVAVEPPPRVEVPPAPATPAAVQPEAPTPTPTPVPPPVVPVPLPGVAPLADLVVTPATPAPQPAPGPVTAVAPAPAGPAPTPQATPPAAPPAVVPVAPAPAPVQPEPAPVVADPTPRPAPVTPPAQPSNLLVADGGVTVLRPGNDRRMAIDSIAYSAAGTVEVAGRAAAGARIRLYLNNVAQFDTLSDAAGDWRGTLPPVAPGLYTLRADQLDGAGKVVERSETPFLREAPEALAAASAVPPAPGVTPQGQMVTVQPGYTLWGIARQTYGEGLLYVKVFEANRAQIRNPDLIYPGQVFALPTAD